MNNKIEVINETNNEIQLINLDSMDFKVLDGKELDKKLIEERNMEMKKLEVEINALIDSIKLIDQLVLEDGEKLEKIEENTLQADIQITVATDTIEETVPLIQSIKEKYMALKMAGAGVSCGLVLGGVGFLVAGPAGAAIGTPVGAGLGTLGGWLTKFI